MPYSTVIGAFGTGCSALSDLHHEQDIWHVVVQQETKANIAGRHRSGGCGSPREAPIVFIDA